MWNHELNDRKKEVRSSFRKWYKSKNEEDWSNYKKVKNLLSREIKKAKENSWRYFVSNTDNVKDLSTLVRNKSNKVSKAFSTLIKDASGTEPTSFEKSAENLLNHHFPNNLKENQIVEQDLHSFEAYHSNSPLIPFISKDKVKKSNCKFQTFQGRRP